MAVKKIILDTNFLLIPAQFKVDIFSELVRICDFKYELIALPETMAELKHITRSSQSSGKDKAAAGMALQLVAKYGVKVPENNRKLFKRADEAIIAIADENSIVATQDYFLRKHLKEKTVRVVMLRQKQYLRFFGE